MRPKLLLGGLGETGSELARLLMPGWDVVGVDVDPAAIEDGTEHLGGVRLRVQSQRSQPVEADPSDRPSPIPAEADDAGADKADEAHPPTGRGSGESPKPPPGAANDDRSDALHLLLGDATSAVVLRRVPRAGLHAAVACAGSDEANLEFLRLARAELGIENRFALMYSLRWRERYVAEGINVVSQDRSCAIILASHVQPGLREVTGMGLGAGEFVEVEVLGSSSVIGRRLGELHPRRWLVGALYRKGKLVVPHGDTVFEAGDRVLLIGEPELLPAIAALIRAGESEFPLQYGSHVVAMCGRAIDALLDETGYLVEHTKAELLEIIACEADESALGKAIAACDERGIPCESSCSAGSTLDSMLEEARRRDVGVLVVPPARMSIWARIGLVRTRIAEILDRVSSPVLVSRRSFPYRRIMIALAELPFHMAAAQVAIDLVRLLGAELQIGLVRQPDIVEGVEHRAALDRRRREIENLAGLYHVNAQTVTVDGNPIHEMERLSRNVDLVVLPFRKGRSASVTRPDVALQIVHRAHCSVLAMPF